MRESTWRWWIAAGAAALALQGCQREAAPADEPSAETSAAAPAPPEVTARVERRANLGAAPRPVERRADFGAAPHSAEVARVADWAVRSGDHQGQAFAIIDKPAARLYVFAADGRLAGASPVLLGAARGDDTVPGIGEKPIAQVKPEERTTPAGRFVAEHGTNLRNEHVVWIDYDAAVSMHPVLTTNPAEHRLERLNATDTAEHRISYGCVNVPAPFFAEVLLGQLAPVPHPVIYVLPDVKPLAEVFPGMAGAASGARADASGKSLRRL